MAVGGRPPVDGKTLLRKEPLPSILLPYRGIAFDQFNIRIGPIESK